MFFCKLPVMKQLKLISCPISLFPIGSQNDGFSSAKYQITILTFQDSVVPGLMYFACAIAGFLSVVLVILLPETKDAVLEDVINKNKTVKTVDNKSEVLY